MTNRHRDFLPISLGVFALVALYAVANDQIIATVSPDHFLVYHPRYFPFDNVRWQALCFSLVATGGPGLGWGILLYWVGHYGPGPVFGRRATVLGAAVVVLVTAAAAWGSGWWVTRLSEPFYPAFFFPSEDPKLYFSQTVQLTNYLVGLTGAIAWLAAIVIWRRRSLPPPNAT